MPSSDEATSKNLNHYATIRSIDDDVDYSERVSYKLPKPRGTDGFNATPIYMQEEDHNAYDSSESATNFPSHEIGKVDSSIFAINESQDSFISSKGIILNYEDNLIPKTEEHSTRYNVLYYDNEEHKKEKMFFVKEEQEQTGESSGYVMLMNYDESVKNEEDEIIGNEELTSRMRKWISKNTIVAKHPALVTNNVPFPPEYFFVKDITEKYITGVLIDLSKIDELLQLHKITTFGTYKLRTTSEYKKKNKRRVLVTDLFTGTPTLAVKNLHAQFLCHRAGLYTSQKHDNLISTPNKKTRNKPSKKVGCSSELLITEYFVFNDLQPSGCSRRKLLGLKRIVEENRVNEYKNLKKTVYLELKLPLIPSHTNHTVSHEDIDVKLPLSAIKDRIYAFSGTSDSSFPLVKNPPPFISSNLNSIGKNFVNGIEIVRNECVDHPDSQLLDFHCPNKNSSNMIEEEKALVLRSGDDTNGLSSWYPAFFICTQSTEEEVCGWVKDELELDFLLDRHKRVTNASFRDKIRRVNKAKEENKLFSKRQDMNIDNHPFSISYRDTFFCINKKIKNEINLAPLEDATIESCNARVLVRKINIYNEVELHTEMTALQRRKILLDLRMKLKFNKDTVLKVPWIYVRMHMKNAHSEFCSSQSSIKCFKESNENIKTTYWQGVNKTLPDALLQNDKIISFNSFEKSYKVKDMVDDETLTNVDDVIASIVQIGDDFSVDASEMTEIELSKESVRKIDDAPKVIPISISDIDIGEKDILETFKRKYERSIEFSKKNAKRRFIEESRRKNCVQENNSILEAIKYALPNCLDNNRLNMVKDRLEEALELCKYTDLNKVFNHNYKSRTKAIVKKRKL